MRNRLKWAVNKFPVKIKTDCKNTHTGSGCTAVKNCSEERKLFMNEVTFEIPAFLLSLVCFVYCLTAKHNQYIPPKAFKNRVRSQHFVYLILLLSNMLSAVSSVVGYYLMQTSFDGIAVWRYLFHMFYFIFHSTLSITFSLYIINVTGTSLSWRKSSYLLFSIPYIISELLVLTNFFTGWAFYMDENDIYHRGPLIIVLYAFGMFYLAMSFYFFFKNKKAISRVDSIAVGVFMVIASIGVILQAIFPNLLIELFNEALAAVLIMIVLEERSGHQDPVTGLLNRVAFADLNRRLISAKKDYGIILIRLSETERYTRILGGRDADEFLLNVAEYLTKESETRDVFCYRRESFAVIFRDAQYNKAMDFAERVMNRFEEEWIIDSLPIKVGAAVSLIRVPGDIRTLEEIEALVYSDYLKIRPGTTFVPVEELLEASRSSFYEKTLRTAIEENKLLVKYQPIWSVKEGRTVSAEALLRVDCDELRNISPEVYIPVAEKTGLIREIGLFVFREVCSFLKDERIRNSGIRFVELNLSVYQFMFSDLIESFENIRAQYGIPAGSINLEITETAATAEEKTVSDTIGQLRQIGYGFSLDDFGTGYSNLIRILESSYQNIKIDKSILWNITGNSGDPKLLRNMMRFIKSLGFAIVQEGVETKEQLDLVSECGCDYIQGYYFSRPISETEFFEYLEKENHKSSAGHTE